MMKYLKRGLFLVVALTLLLMPAASFAEDGDEPQQDQQEYVGRIAVDSTKYPLANYQLGTNIGDGILDAGDNALFKLNQALWGINKTLASITIYTIKNLMTFDLINEVADSISAMSQKIYEVYGAVFIGTLIAAMAGVSGYRALVNQQFGVAVKTLVGALIILAISHFFYANTTTNVKAINSFGGSLEALAAQSNVFMSTQPVSNNKASNANEGIAVLENQIFDLTVMRPYLLLNYGTTKEAQVNADDSSRVDSLLQPDPYSDEGEDARKEVIAKEVDEYNNRSMTAAADGDRAGYLFVTIISTVAISIPMIFLAALRFLLQVSFIGLIVFMGIPMILSLIPAFMGSLMNHAKKIVYVILMKGALMLLIFVVTGITSLIYGGVQATSDVSGFAYIVLITVITVIALIKSRDQILEVASVGMIQGEKMTNRITESAKQATDKGFAQTKRMASKGMDYIAHKRAGAKIAKFASKGMNKGNGGSGAGSGNGLSVARQAGAGEVGAVGSAGAAGAPGQSGAMGAPGKAGGNTAGALGASKVGTMSAGAIPQSASRSASGGITNISDYRDRNPSTGGGAGSMQPAGASSNRDAAGSRSPSRVQSDSRNVGAAATPTPSNPTHSPARGQAPVSTSSGGGGQRSVQRTAPSAAPSSSPSTPDQSSTPRRTDRLSASSSSQSGGGPSQSRQPEENPKHPTQWEVKQQLKQQRESSPMRSPGTGGRVEQQTTDSNIPKFLLARKERMEAKNKNKE